MKYRAFVTGLGSIGMGYDYADRSSLGITHCRAIQKHTKFEFAGAHDLDEAKGERFQIEYGSQFYIDLTRGLRETNPDLVIVSTPTDLHLSSIKTVLKFSSPRVILCEKPLSFKTLQAKQIQELALLHDSKIFVNYFRNSQPYINNIVEQISLGILKLPVKGRCIYSKGVFNTGTHFLNLLESLFGEISQVTTIRESKKFLESGDMDVNAEFSIGDSRFKLEYIPNAKDLIFEMELQFQNGCLRYLNEGNEITWEESTAEKGKELNCSSYLTLPAQAQFEVLNEISNFLEGRNYSLCELSRGVRYIELLTQVNER